MCFPLFNFCYFLSSLFVVIYCLLRIQILSESIHLSRDACCTFYSAESAYILTSRGKENAKIVLISRFVFFFWFNLIIVMSSHVWYVFICYRWLLVAHNIYLLSKTQLSNQKQTDRVISAVIIVIIRNIKFAVATFAMNFTPCGHSFAPAFSGNYPFAANAPFPASIDLGGLVRRFNAYPR